MRIHKVNPFVPWTTVEMVPSGLRRAEARGLPPKPPAIARLDRVVARPRDMRPRLRKRDAPT